MNDTWYRWYDCAVLGLRVQDCTEQNLLVCCVYSRSVVMEPNRIREGEERNLPLSGKPEVILDFSM